MSGLQALDRIRIPGADRWRPGRHLMLRLIDWMSDGRDGAWVSRRVLLAAMSAEGYRCASVSLRTLVRDGLLVEGTVHPRLPADRPRTVHSRWRINYESDVVALTEEGAVALLDLAAA